MFLVYSASYIVNIYASRGIMNTVTTTSPIQSSMVWETSRQKQRCVNLIYLSWLRQIDNTIGDRNTIWYSYWALLFTTDCSTLPSLVPFFSCNYSRQSIYFKEMCMKKPYVDDITSLMKRIHIKYYMERIHNGYINNSYLYLVFIFPKVYCTNCNQTEIMTCVKLYISLRVLCNKMQICME